MWVRGQCVGGWGCGGQRTSKVREEKPGAQKEYEGIQEPGACEEPPDMSLEGNRAAQTIARLA